MKRHSGKVKLTFDSKTSEGEATIEEYYFIDGVKYGSLTWLLIWLATIPTIFIPVAHFLLVPLGFFGGIAMGFIMFAKYKNSRGIIDGKGPCPTCNAEVHFAFQQVSHADYGHCNHCHKNYRVAIC